MINKSNILYLIPARGGSKGIPRKNIKNLGGKPLIYYSIDVARKLTSDDMICVSTDDNEIKEVVEAYGLSIPFLRPSHLAKDNASSNDVIIHALRFFENRDINIEVIVLLQPTSPLRTSIQVSEAISMYSDEIDMVVSVTEAKSNPYYHVYTESSNGFQQKLLSSSYARRQDCPKVWEHNGSVYVINPESLKKYGSLQKFKNVIMYKMNQFSSLDLDTEFDWMFCEYLMDKKEKIY